MIKRWQITLLITFSLLRVNQIHAQILTQDQEEQFRQKIYQLMKTHAESNQLTLDWERLDQTMIDKLKGTFTNTTKKIVFNDLLPQNVKEDKYLSPIGYILFAQRYFPEGIDVVLDVLNIEITNKDHKNGTCKALVKAKKTVRGLYQNKKIHKFSDILYYYIDADLIEGQIQGVLITRVADTKMHAQVEGNKIYGGLYVGISGGYSQNVLYYPQIIGDKNWAWKVGSNVHPMLEVHYMLTRGFGLATGIKVGSYSPGLSLKKFSEQLSTPFTDQDNDTYYPIYDISNFQEINSIKSIDIPLFLKFRTGAGNVGFYIDAGIVYSSYSSMSYTLSGTATRKGYYPAYNVILENIPEYNFFSNYTFNPKDRISLQTPSYGLSGLVSLGVSISVYKDIMLRVGISTYYGLVSMGNSIPSHSVDYFNTTGIPKNDIFLHSASIEIGLYYRVFVK